MAIYDGKNFKGSIGNVSFRKNGAVTVVQQNPGKGNVKQTAATKRTASRFGEIISPLAKHIRIAFREPVMGFYDGSMVNRMNSAISIIINQHLVSPDSYQFNEQSFSRLNDFDFNLNSLLNRYLLIKPSLNVTNSSIKIELAKFDVSTNVKFPKLFNDCQIQFTIGMFCLRNGLWITKKMDLDPIVKGQGMSRAQTFECNLQSGILYIAVVSLVYTTWNNNRANHKTFHPCGIIGSYMHQGLSEREELKNWLNMDVKL